MRENNLKEETHSHYASKMSEFEQKRDEVNRNIEMLDNEWEYTYNFKQWAFQSLGTLKSKWGNCPELLQLEEEFDIMNKKSTDEYETKRENWICQKKNIERDMEDHDQEYQQFLKSENEEGSVESYGASD